jgi:TonB-dependent starch-binding outer membrane protein SusC
MKRVWRVIVVFAVLSVAPLAAQGPTGTVRGRVVDSSTLQPVVNASVTIGDRGAVTDNEGRYTIAGVPTGAQTVRIQMVGYAELTQPVTVTAGQVSEVDLSLEVEAISLAEVVVTGYGIQRAGNITGAVSRVTTDEFNTGRIVSPEELIQSKVPGVQIVDNNEPGGGVSIRVRGPTSINASSDPLYVIDGVPIGSSGGGESAGRNPLNFLNPNDIESITVLRDASAGAIYGANAANGVVLIRTKAGTGTPTIEYSGSVSGSFITRTPDVLNAAQFREAVQEHAPQHVNQLANANTDWFDLVARDAFGQEHNVAVSGAGESMNYRFSVGYLTQDGVIDGTTTERLSLGLNYNQRLFDDYLNVRANLKGARNDDAFTPGGVLSNAAQMGPTQPVSDGAAPGGYYDWPGDLLTSPDNPVAILDLATDNGTTYRSIGNLQGEYRLPFFEALSANVNLGYDVTSVERETFTPSVLHSQRKTGTGGTLYRENPAVTNAVVDAYLAYVAPVGGLPGIIDMTAGYSYSQSHAEYPWLNAQGLSTDLLGDAGIPGTEQIQNDVDIQESRLISFFGRVNYNIEDRYLFAASIRRDGSSRFGPGNEWGMFPSVAAAWRVSDESLFQDAAWLSDLKLRAAWGKTGNQAFANYQQYTTYLVGDAQTQALFGDEYVTTIRPGAADPNIKWEETTSVNLGLDFGFSDQRFSGAIDWYQKDTEDLIFTVPVAAGTNLSNFVTTNIGSMKNHGLELALSARVLDGATGGLRWTASFNASRNTNELTSINPFAGEAQQILTGLVAGGVGTFIQVLTPGQPVNSFLVYQQKYDGSGRPLEGEYEDLDGDGNITVADRRPFHDPAPKWILGHSSSLGWGSFDLGFTLRAYLDSWVYNNVASNLGTYQEVGRGSPYNLHASVLETGFESPQYLSDYYVEDASFLRMDNLSVGYSFAFNGQPMRAFGAVQSVFTLTGYSGVDATAGLNGLDNNIYPRSRTFTGGLSVRF